MRLDLRLELDELEDRELARDEAADQRREIARLEHNPTFNRPSPVTRDGDFRLLPATAA